ncbi:MAG: hypothetical protein ACI9DC_003858 [Gammaproteobacteria bacterium]|jgi:hypothetical protein
MNTQPKDTRLNPADLETAVDFAYGGAAIRAGRQLQARAVAKFFSRMTKGLKSAKS